MKRKGFTFIELLVVITIIGVIFAAASVAFSVITVRSRDAKRISDLELIRQALEMCRSTVGYYPSEIYGAGGIQCTNVEPITVTLAKVPTDPRPSESCNSQYTYVPDITDYRSYQLTSCLESGTGASTHTVTSP